MIRLLAIVLFLCGWAAAHIHYSMVDIDTCAKAGVPFGGESLSLEGFCMYGTIMVPVGAYR